MGKPNEMGIEMALEGFSLSTWRFGCFKKDLPHIFPIIGLANGVIPLVRIGGLVDILL